MDFFGRQELARRNSRWLLLWFVLAVLAIMLAINVVAWLALQYAGTQTPSFAAHLLSPTGAIIAALTLAVIALGSGLRMAQLASGGKAVADMVGARRVLPETSDPLERRLINVSEEMAIAAGLPVPRLYVMDNEPAINAFVAGLKPNETVMVVTRGALEQLDRQELQGVVGHEYSHVFNGDMRLNVRLIGALAGILLIGQCGEFMLRNLRHVRGGSSSRRDSGNAVFFLLILSLALMVIGYVGLFFGRLIKAAIARQREFLADAASVQYTRDNSGIAGALDKIRQHSSGALLQTPYAEDMSHLCFGASVKLHLAGLLSTHPPLDERIRALGVQPAQLAARRRERSTETAASGAASAASPVAVAGENRLAQTRAAAALASVGQFSVHAINQAQQQRAQWPDAVQVAAHDRQQIHALILALLLQDQADSTQRDVVAATLLADAPELLRTVQNLHRELQAVPASARLSLLLVTRNTLEHLSRAERDQLLAQCRQLSRQDQWVTPFEFVICAIVDAWLRETPGHVRRVTRFRDVAAELVCVTGFLVQASRADLAVQQAQFTGALASFGLPVQAMPAQFDADALAVALQRLDACVPLLKKPMLNTFAELVLADGELTVSETELLRAIAEQLNCPMPPLLA